MVLQKRAILKPQSMLYTKKPQMCFIFFADKTNKDINNIENNKKCFLRTINKEILY